MIVLSAQKNVGYGLDDVISHLTELYRSKIRASIYQICRIRKNMSVFITYSPVLALPKVRALVFLIKGL